MPLEVGHHEDLYRVTSQGGFDASNVEASPDAQCDFNVTPPIGMGAESTPVKENRCVGMENMEVKVTPSVTPINPGFEKEVGEKMQ